MKIQQVYFEIDQPKGIKMKALMATMMITLAVCFTGCSGGDDAAAPEAPQEEAEPKE
jgi:hypothetical protein